MSNNPIDQRQTKTKLKQPCIQNIEILGENKEQLYNYYVERYLKPTNSSL